MRSTLTTGPNFRDHLCATVACIVRAMCQKSENELELSREAFAILFGNRLPNLVKSLNEPMEDFEVRVDVFCARIEAIEKLPEELKAREFEKLALEINDANKSAIEV